MSFNVQKLAGKLNRLIEEKRQLTLDYECNSTALNRQIKIERDSISKINELLTPYLCKKCGGAGEETYSDAAGSKDYRECSSCGGSRLKRAE